MSLIDRKVREVRRRLTSNLFGDRLALGVIIGAGLWAVLVLVERAFVLGIPERGSLIAAGIAALLIAAIGTILARVNNLRAAIAIDQAAGLKERVSTALACRASDDPFARATIRDAEEIASRVHVPAHVPLRAPQLWPLSSALVVVSLILYGFMPTLDLLAADPANEREQREDNPFQRGVVEVALKEKKVQLKRRLEDKPGMDGLKADLEALELPDDPTMTPEDVRRDVVKKIENIADKFKNELEDNQMKSLDALKRDLAKLDYPEGDDPASKLAQSLGQGDLKGARDALADLKKKLELAAKTADADPAAKAKLAEMQKKLDQLAGQLEKLAKTDRLQKELENKAGLSPEDAKKLLEKLAQMDPKQMEKALQKALANKGLNAEQIKQMAKKLAQQQQAKQQLQQMAQALQKAAQAAQQGQNGNGQDAAAAGAAALGDAMNMMSELELAEQMMLELQADLAELSDLKADVCQGNFPGKGPRSDKIGGQGPQRGLGYGARTGKKTAAFQYAPTKVKSQLTRGEIIGQMLIDGPQLKGEATAETREAVNAAVRDATDAIEREQVPRQYERVLRSYFESLAGLATGGATAPAADSGEEPSTNASDD